MKKKINILSTVNINFNHPILNKLKKYCFIRNKINSKNLSEAKVYLSSASKLVDTEFVNKAKNLKLILSPNTGTDHLDLDYLKKKKIKVIHIAKERKLLNSFTSTSELVFALILSLNRKLIQAQIDVKRGKWTREKFKGYQLQSKTLGILGLGRLGSITSKIANGFGMNVIGYDIKKIKLKNVKNVSLKYLFKKSDIVSIHIHLNQKNQNFINKKLLSLMKKKSILINTSRGKIIDERDLLNKLKKNSSFNVGLDVIDGEWLPRKKLLKHPLISYSRRNDSNLLIVPHIGGSTEESILGARVFILEKLYSLIKQKKL
jgi:phosphoglycerate dehydrogenase-like enzyme